MYINASMRVFHVDGTSNKFEYLLKHSSVMKWKSTEEILVFWGATVIDLKEFPRSHPETRIRGMRTSCTLFNEYICGK